MYRKFENVPVWGNPLAKAVDQIVRVSRQADRAALMADHHLGYSVPIGGVVAYKDKVTPNGVGFDIACGNKAVLLDIPANEVRKNIKKIMNDVWSHISFGMGLKNKDVVDHELYDDYAWSIPICSSLYDLARAQLGTVGSGNHYVDLFVDDEGRVWCGVHFGTRGFGHKIATHFLKEGGAKDGIDSDCLLLDVNSSLGAEYLECMRLAGRYAYAGRDWVCNRVADILGANILDQVHNHHNFAWREHHAGEDFWVIRKGATPAFPGQKGFIGGSMGDISVIVEGVESEESKDALYSTVHGAGRVLSRTQARGKITRKKIWSCGQRDCSGKLPNSTPQNQDGSNPKCPECGSKMVKLRRGSQLTSGQVSKEMMFDWVKAKGVELRGAGVDESPHCYKRLPEVLNWHKQTIKVLNTLTPIGVAMAGENEHDPYKD